MSKIEEYKKLVADRKKCDKCAGLINPAYGHYGCFDCNEIGPWSRWQGNLDASLMVVGQDWGDTGDFLTQKGREGKFSPTNHALVELLSIDGVSIGDPGSQKGRDIAFFTNAILCLKDLRGGLQGKVRQEWFNNCVSFLRKQIEIVLPRVVVGLGKHAYQAILLEFDIDGKFPADVEKPEGRLLWPNGPRAFAVYHCGMFGQNINRSKDLQIRDWKRIRPFIKKDR